MGKVILGDREVIFKPMVLASVSPTTSTDIVNQVQTIVETTAGTWNASGTMVYLSPMAQCLIQTSRGITPIGDVGNVSVHTLAAGLQGGAFALGNMTPNNVTCIKRGVNRYGTTSMSETLSVLMKENLGGTLGNYISANFGRYSSITLTGMPGMPLLMDAGIITRFPTIGTADPCSGITKVSASTTAPIMFGDGGETPIDIDGAQPTVGAMQVTISHAPRAITPVGPKDYVAMPLRRATYTGRISILHTGTTHWSNYSLATGGTIAWTIVTGSGTLSLTDYRFDNGRLAYSSAGDEVWEVYDFIAKGGTFTP